MVVNIRTLLLSSAIFIGTVEAVLLNFDEVVNNRVPSQVLQELIQNTPYLIIKFFKQGCGPCQQSNKVMHAIAQEYPAVTIVEINVGKYYELFRPYNLNSVPSFIFYQNGNYQTTHKGGGATLSATLRTLIQQYFSL